MVGRRRGEDLTDEERCVHIKVTGERCRGMRTEPGVTLLCRWHEESLARRAEYWQRIDNVPDMSLEEHLSIELKMSWVMIRELEFQVLDLGLSVDGFQIKTTETETKTSEEVKNTYVSVKEARLHGAHPVILHYLREREQHMAVVKTCIAAGLAAKQVAIVERYVDSLIASQFKLAEKLGQDPNSPHIRTAIMEVVREQQSELSDVMGRGDTPPALGQIR